MDTEYPKEKDLLWDKSSMERAFRQLYIDGDMTEYNSKNVNGFISLITFECVRWKNFLSTGNNFTEIQLDRSSTTLIIGENGAGKSTILDALCLVCLGNPFVISKATTSQLRQCV